MVFININLKRTNQILKKYISEAVHNSDSYIDEYNSKIDMNNLNNDNPYVSI